MKLFFCFFSLFSLIVSDQIYTKDPIIDYSNTGYFSNLGVPFMLTSPLASTDYLNLITSFNLHSQIQNSLSLYTISNYFTPSNLYMNLSTYASDCVISSSKTPALAYTKSVDSTTYLIRFMDGQNNFIGLTQGIWYVLWINMTDPNVLNMQVSGKLLQIQMRTISSSVDNSLQYDINPVVSVFQLLDAPPQTLQVSVSYDSPTQQNVLLANNLVYIDITTSVIVQNSAIIKYILTDNSFQFSGQCISVAKTDNPTIPALLSSNYTCGVNTLDNSMTVTFSNAINSVFSLRIKVFIVNPPRVINSGSIKAFLSYGQQGIIAETGQSSPTLSTVNIAFALNKLNLAWNINPANSSSFPFPMQIIRADSASPGYYPYNSFVLNFAVQSSTPSNMNLRMNIDLITPTGAIFLPGSISETLPSYDTNTKVSCVLASSADSTRKIQCTGLGQLVASTTYKIGFKMSFPYDIYYPSITIQNTFGVLYIESFNSYLNSYDTNYLIPRTSPQNVQSLSSVNNKNWLPTGPTYQKTAVSSQAISSSIVDPSVSTNLGISTSSASQRLIFSLNAPYSDISSSSSTAGTSITNSAGLYIMTNNIFPQTTSTTASFEDSTGTTDASISVTISSSSNTDIAYGLITFSASNSNGLLKAFSATATDKIFAFNPFTISQSCSIYCDSGNYDFYIVSVDGIAGTYNQQTFNNYALINAQCNTPSSFASIQMGISNFWTGNSAAIGGLTGSVFTALLYISGTLTSTESTNVKKLVVFLQNVAPYSSLQSYYNNQNYVYCNTMEEKSNCSGVINPYPDYTNFMSMDKVELSITNPSSLFSIVIPLQTLANQNNIYAYFATMGTSSYYPSNKLYYQILLASKRYSWSFTASSSALSYPFLLTGITSPNYGIDASCLTCYPGNTVSVNMNIGHTDTGVLTYDDSSNFGAGYTYVSTNNFTTSSTTFTSPLSIATSNPCITFNYSPDQVNLRYGFFCPFTTGTVGPSSTIALNQITLPYLNGGYLIGGVGTFSLKTGALASASLDSGTIANKGIISNLLFTPTNFIKGIVQSRIVWSFQTTNPITNNNYIRITLSQSSCFITTANSYCLLRYSSGISIPHTCSITNENSLNFGYVISTSVIIAAGKFDMIHYGIDSTNSNGSATTFSVYLISQQNSIDNNYIIDQSAAASPGSFGYNNNPITFPTLSLSTSFNNYNSKSKTFFDIGFQINSRGLYPTESIMLDLTSLENDNMNNLDYECLVLDSNKAKSPDFQSATFSTWSQISLIAKNEIISFSQNYYFRCYHIIVPSVLNSNGGFNFSGYVASSVNSAITAITSVSASLLNTFNYTTIFSYFELNFIENDLSSPGNTQDLKFSITSTNENLTNTSRIIVWFPYYYPPLLNSDGTIYCLINEIDVLCNVDQIRRLVVQYLPFTLTAGSSFVLRIIGPQQGIVQFYSSFYVALDLDSDDTYYLELGSFSDIAYKTLSQYTLVNLMMYSINFSSTYIRDSIDSSFQFFLPDSLGVELLATDTFFIVEFPSFYNILLNVTPPACAIYNLDEKILSNYAQSCSVIGSQIKIILSNDLTQGYNYNIQINGVRGPSWQTCVTNRWIINLISGNQMILVARTFFNSENIGVQNFGLDPSKTLLSYLDVNTGKVITTYQMTPGVYSLPIKVAETNAFDKSFLLSPSATSIFSNYPSTVYSEIGTLQTTFQISCYQNTSYGIYYFSLDKTGDGNYYTDLPIVPINISYNPVSLTFDVTSFSIPVGSTNFIILIKEPTQMPNDYINLTFSLSNQSSSLTGLSLIQNSIKFNQFNSYGFISLSSSYNQSYVGKSANLQISISGTNANSYSLSTASFSLNMVANVSYSLSVTLGPNLNPSNVLTSSFTMSCSVAAVGYYQLSTSECSFVGISSVISNVNEFYSYNSNDMCQMQFGVIYFESNGLTKTVNIANLRSNKNYTIWGFCQDFVGNYSSVQNATFSGKDNGGQLMKNQFTFQSNISRTNKERLTCFLTTLLGVEPQRVMTSDLVYCQTFTESRLLSNISNSTNSSNSSNISYYPLDFYFLPIDDREIDKTWQTISAYTNFSADFMNWVTGNITGLPNLTSISQAYSIPNNVYPNFSSTSNASLTIYDYWISVADLSLTANGSIYLIIYQGILSNDTTPTYSEIINNQKSDGSNGVEAARIQFIVGINSSCGYNFTNLSPNTSYIIAYFGTNENPSYQDFLKTDIKKANTSTKNIILSSFAYVLKVYAMVWFAWMVLIMLQ